MPDDTTASTDTPPDDTDPEQPTSPPVTRAPLPDCFDTHLTRDPIIREENRIRLQEDVTVPIAPTIATALVLQEDDQILGVVRLIHDPLDRHVHIYDAADAACEPIPDARPHNTTNNTEETTHTTLALAINNQNYTLTIDGVPTGSNFNTTLAHTPQDEATTTTAG